MGVSPGTSVSANGTDGPLMVDITCRHPTPAGSAPPPVDGLAAWFASQAEDKDSLYLDKCRRQGYSFLPFVVTPWGGLGPEALKVTLRLQKLALGTKRGWAGHAWPNSFGKNCPWQW